jgi:Retrotransposon gag protein/Zinc knuckle
MQQVEPFNGKVASKATEFLTQLRHVFETTPLGSRPDEEKVSYAISRLRDRAHAWVQAYRDKVPPPAWLSDYDLFAAEFLLRFGKPPNQRNAANNLRSLRQTGSVVDYATEFQQAAAVLGWPDPPLMAQFEHGLKDAVKDELYFRAIDITDLESYIRMAITIDQYLQEKAGRRTREPQPHHQPPRKLHSQGRSVPAMPAPRGSMSAPARGSEPRPHAPYGAVSPSVGDPKTGRPRRLTEQEKEYRFRNNLCLYCGEPGHLARDCAVRPKVPYRPARASEATYANDKPSGNAPAQRQ